MNDQNPVRHSLDNNSHPSWQSPDYSYGAQPGPYTPPPAPPTPPQPKKMPKWAKLLIGVLAIPALTIGGCIAIVGGSGIANQVAQTADKSPVPGAQSTYDPGINTPMVKPSATPKPTVKPSPKVTHKPAPTLTAAQEQAAGSASDYLNVSAFSRAGLIKQLEFEGFGSRDATVGVDSLKIDWSAQAVLSARAYLDTQHFSRKGLIAQLKFQGFTTKQATYGVEAAGL